MEYIPAKTIVSRTKNGQEWFGVDYNMNIYRGCSHGCIYCDSRSRCYQIEDFGRIRAKQDALRIIRDELLARRKRGVVATGAMSDPYNPHEKELKLTGNALELLNACRFGAAIATKSSLITRDTGVLRDIQSHSPVIVKITVTTASDDLSRRVEPHAPLSGERFAALEKLSGSGIYAGILMMPLLPFIEDTEENILAIIRRAKESGARFIYPAIGVTLRTGNREYFYAELDRHFPGTKEKYMRQYGERYRCDSPRAGKLWTVFAQKCAELGLRHEMKDIIADYKREHAAKQFGLFE
ncbi:MAG: radical SAM protein [Spirochaetaceae bacterium]|jgi:DNA repair photolyase|nr:radical SAM protein [Spirochaetaceae bacterium]